ncbi:MAG: PAQR family membrane homeostasis protein TrhA [Gaiellaceae bacterium]
MAAVRPRLRGVLHQYAFFVSVVCGVLLVLGASGAGERVSAVVFAAAVATMFGVSALYHRITWRPGPRRWMRRLDHAAIYLLIAGTYTPFGLLALSGAWRWTVLPVVWGGALAAIVFKLAWVDAPKWVAAAIAVALGWVGVVALPQLWHYAGFAGLLLLAAGGVLYTGGAVVYARGRPDPYPAVFGYHELFHALVIAAAACQYAAVAGVVFD